MTPTFTHTDLVRLAERWLIKQGCTVVITDMGSDNRETPDAIGWKTHRSILVECKAFRSDFMADSRKFFRRTPEFGMGVHRYYLAPEGVIRADEIPQGWGLLAPGPRSRLRHLAFAVDQECNRPSELKLMASALRRTISAGDVRGVRCRHYVWDDGGEPRATISVKAEVVA